MKKSSPVLALLLALAMLLCLSACGENAADGSGTPAPSTSNPEGGQPSSSDEEVSFLLFNNKYEYDAPLKEIAARYHELHPNVTVEIESMTSDAYTTDLATRFAGGVEPDIFICVGNSDILNWEPYLEDLSDQPWVSDVADVAIAPVSVNGHFYGFPLSMVGGGYMYNTALFEKAGIEGYPKTPSELEAAVQKLRDAGYIALIETYSNFYQPGNFMAPYGFAAQDDPMAFIQGLNDGTESMIGNEAMLEMANYWNWEASICDNTMDYDFSTQISLMANQEAAITYGGNWSQVAFDEVDPDLPLSLMPIPMSENAEENDYLLGGCTNYWVVNKNSKALDAVKDFLTWLATDPEGQQQFTGKLKLIPGFKSFTADEKDIGSLGRVVQQFLSEGKLYDYYRGYFPSGCTQAFGDDMGRMAAGLITPEEYVACMQDAWDRLKK